MCLIRFCRDEDTFYNYEMNEFIPLHFNMTPVDFLAEWQVFAVIRDPFERFFSAYSDKCIRLFIRSTYIFLFRFSNYLLIRNQNFRVLF